MKKLKKNTREKVYLKKIKTSKIYLESEDIGVEVLYQTKKCMITKRKNKLIKNGNKLTKRDKITRKIFI